MIKQTIATLSGVFASVCLYLYGGLDTPLIVFFIAILCDYITGICKGIYHKNLSSKYGFRGLFKKLAMCLIIAFVVQLDNLVGSSGMIRNFAIFYYVANEGLSILENLVSMDIPFPSSIKNVLEQIKEQSK